MAPSLPTIDDASKVKAQAAQAWAAKQSAALNGEFTMIWMGSNFKANSPSAVKFIAKVRKTDPSGAAVLSAFFADPAAQRAMLDKVAPIKTPGENLNDIAHPDLSGLNPVSGIASVLSTLTNANTWLRVGEGILGLLLITVGVVAITKSTSAGKALASTAGKVAKVV
jgi:hypothetical protein